MDFCSAGYFNDSESFNQHQSPASMDLSDQEYSPLGLTLRKTPSFLQLVEKKLLQGWKSGDNSEASVEAANPEKEKFIGYYEFASQYNLDKEKLKASSFPVSLLKIGNWTRVSRYECDLVGKLYYAKRKIVWEFLEHGLKSKIEVRWSEIAAIRAIYTPNRPDVLEIEVKNEPAYFLESDPQPKKHTLWQPTSDFTGGQAQCCRRHYVQCEEGTLEMHYEKLLQCDQRLSELSQAPFPAAADAEYRSYKDGMREHPSEVISKHHQQLPPAFASPPNSMHIFPPQIGISYQHPSPLLKTLVPTPHDHFNSASPCSGHHLEAGVWIDKNCYPRNALHLDNPPLQEQLHPFTYSLHQPPLSTPPPPTAGTTTTTGGVSSPANNWVLNVIEEHLLSEPVAAVDADEEKVLAKVNSMSNLLNAAGSHDEHNNPSEDQRDFGEFYQGNGNNSDANVEYNENLLMFPHMNGNEEASFLWSHWR